MEYFGTIIKLPGNKKEAVVLSPQTGFTTIRRKESMFLGQRVAFFTEDIVKPGRKPLQRYIAFAAPAAAILVLLFSYLYFINLKIPEAYMDIDINPSIELIFDKNYIVIDTESINEDGSAVLKTISIKGKTSQEAVALIVKEASRQGYIGHLDKKSAVVLSGWVKNSQNDYVKMSKMRQVLMESARSASKAVSGVVPKILVSTQEEYRNARKNNISTAKYYIYQAAANKGHDYPIELIKNESISQIISNIDNRILSRLEDITPGEKSAAPMSPAATQVNVGGKKLARTAPVPLKTTAAVKTPEPRKVIAVKTMVPLHTNIKPVKKTRRPKIKTREPVKWTYTMTKPVKRTPRPAIDAFKTIEAVDYSASYGIKREDSDEGGSNIGFLDPGDWVEYENVDFGDGVNTLVMRAASQYNCVFDIRVDSPCGDCIGYLYLPSTGAFQTFKTNNWPCIKGKGVHDVYIVCDKGRMEIKWFKFK